MIDALLQGLWLEVGYLGPEEVLKMFNGLLDQPPEVQKEMVKYIKFGN